MSDAEFFDLTPRQFAKLFDRHLEERKRFELVISMNTVATIASSFSPPETLPSYDRFMPSSFLPPPPEPTEEEVAMDLGAAFRGILDLSQRAFPVERKRRNRKRE